MFIETTRRLLVGTVKAVSMNPVLFVKVCGAWTVLLAVLSIVSGSVTNMSAGHTTSFQPADIPYLVGGMISAASISVAWIRGVLLKTSVSSINLRFQTREAIFFFWTIIIILILGAFVFLFAILDLILSFFVANLLFFVGSGAFQVFSYVAVAAIVAFVSFLYAALSLILPAKALDEDLTLKQAFYESRGLRLPMIVSYLVVGGVLLCVYYLIDFLVPAESARSVLGAIKTFVLEAVANLGLVLYTGILTGGYYILRERQMPSGGGPQAPETPES
ncbi:hypothetical protein [Stappia stellulata]|uniref:hypothetical protein n=1 Tax=Stappia stellulata TaxID=71235 RepID=UPI00048B8168|nr:hypothetical protein [Stappia stellulata]